VERQRIHLGASTELCRLIWGYFPFDPFPLFFFFNFWISWNVILENFCQVPADTLEFSVVIFSDFFPISVLKHTFYAANMSKYICYPLIFLNNWELYLFMGLLSSDENMNVELISIVNWCFKIPYFMATLIFNVIFSDR
jgi:hypothetical protein